MFRWRLSHVWGLKKYMKAERLAKWKDKPKGRKACLLSISQVVSNPHKAKRGPCSKMLIQSCFSHRPIQTRVSVQLSKAPSGFVETSFYELARWLPHHNTVRNRGDTPSASEGWFLQLLGLALLKGDLLQ